MVIGVSGVAGSGKDLFTEVLTRQLEEKGESAVRVALADALKEETRDWCTTHYGIDPLRCSREDKEKIRGFLVCHGTFKRHLTNGRHWIERATEQIEEVKRDFKHVIVSDVRYAEYEKDETHWVQKELDGKLVHVSQFIWAIDTDHGSEIKRYKSPANSEEKRNDPIVREIADYLLSWEFVKKRDPKNINKDKYVNNEVVKFIEWLNAQ
tara:strand:+ start:1950 stop:2576 length:627 start_codon:yes stop_codon:yes gene_type:complete